MHIKIINTISLIRATPVRQLNLEECKNLLLAIALIAKHSDKYYIIIDTRKTKSIMSVIDLWYLSAHLYEYKDTFAQKTVILYKPEHFDNVDFFSLCSINRGYKVNAYPTYEEGIEWLLGNG